MPELDKIGLYRVEYTLPPDGDRYRYARNMQSNVLTTTLPQALVVVSETHPEATVHAAHRLSARSERIIVDKGILDALREE